MFVFSIIVSAIEFVVAGIVATLIIDYDAFAMASLIFVMVPLLPLSIVSLIGSIRSVSRLSSKPKAITAIALSGAAIVNFIILFSLMMFMFSQGGRLPHEVFY